MILTVHEFVADNLADIIRDHMQKTEIESPADDELNIFESEGSGNTVGSLSSLSLHKPKDQLNNNSIHGVLV